MYHRSSEEENNYINCITSASNVPRIRVGEPVNRLRGELRWSAHGVGPGART